MTFRPPRPLIHRARAVATILAIVATTALAAVAPAQADVLDVVCAPPSSSTGTFDPPLTTTPQDVTVTRTTLFGPCVSATVPGLTSGVTSTSFPFDDVSCTDLLSSDTVVSTITWNTGHTSVLTVNQTGSVVGGLFVVTQTGTVTAGLFQGDPVVRTTQAPATDVLLCLLGLGTVSTIYSVGELAITSL